MTYSEVLDDAWRSNPSSDRIDAVEASEEPYGAVWIVRCYELYSRDEYELVNSYRVPRV